MAPAQRAICLQSRHRPQVGAVQLARPTHRSEEGVESKIWAAS